MNRDQHTNQDEPTIGGHHQSRNMEAEIAISYNISGRKETGDNKGGN